MESAEVPTSLVTTTARRRSAVNTTERRQRRTCSKGHGDTDDCKAPEANPAGTGPTTTVTTGGGGPAVDVSGHWSTQFGGSSAPMTLSVSGAHVSGSYELSTSIGTVDGTMSGYEYDGHWSDKYGDGHFVFTFSHDGKSFMGKWGDNATWNGTKDD